MIAADGNEESTIRISRALGGHVLVGGIDRTPHVPKQAPQVASKGYRNTLVDVH